MFQWIACEENDVSAGTGSNDSALTIESQVFRRLSRRRLQGLGCRQAGFAQRLRLVVDGVPGLDEVSPGIRSEQKWHGTLVQMPGDQATRVLACCMDITRPIGQVLTLVPRAPPLDETWR